MIRCPQCHTENADNAQYCAQCGAEMRPSRPASAPVVGPVSGQAAPPRPSSRDALRVGQSVNGGLYRITRELGKGGMGAIYLAENTQAFGRQCVIKEMIAYYEPGEEAKAHARFEVEARTLAALKHPGIPDMYGFFSEGGSNYIVMEYIAGENLQQILDRRSGTGAALPEEDIVRYGIEICRVLEYLATVTPEPVVHCDIKPANIIIDGNSGQAVLVDFGTAKARYSKTAVRPDGKRPSVYGTVGYAAPELYSGMAVPRSDVFALAATMYALLTGDDPQEHPFKWLRLGSVTPTLRAAIEAALASEAGSRSNAETFRKQLDDYRAALNGAVQPLTFPGGNSVTSLTGVLEMSVRHWDYARRILYDGSLDHWLRNTLHDPVAAERAAEARNEHADLPDAGLDAFVRGLSPRLSPPRIALAPAMGDLGKIAEGESKRYRYPPDQPRSRRRSRRVALWGALAGGESGDVRAAPGRDDGRRIAGHGHVIAQGRGAEHGRRSGDGGGRSTGRSACAHHQDDAP